MENNENDFQTMTDKVFDKFEMKKYLYYFIIGIISLIACVFLPMVGSSADLGWKFPNTTVGIIIWVVVRLCVAVINIMLFYCFMEQAKVNIKDDENYKKANEILNNLKYKKRIPRGPEQWQGQQYSTKGVTIFISSLCSAIALTQAILVFDWVSMLTYIFTILMGVIFGILQMKSAECYWTNEFYQYALMMQKQNDDNKGEENQCSQSMEKN